MLVASEDSCGVCKLRLLSSPGCDWCEMVRLLLSKSRVDVFFLQNFLTGASLTDRFLEEAEVVPLVSCHRHRMLEPGSSCHFFSSILLFGQSDFQVSQTIFDSREIIFLELLLLFWSSDPATFWSSCWVLAYGGGSSVRRPLRRLLKNQHFRRVPRVWFVTESIIRFNLCVVYVVIHPELVPKQLVAI